MIGGKKFLKLWKFWEISRKKIEINQRQSQIITGGGLHSWSPGLVTKIILIIFTTVNDSPNLADPLLIAFSDLEKQKQKFFFEKHCAGAHANIEKIPHRASLNHSLWSRWRANARNISFGGRFTLPAKLITTNVPSYAAHRRSTTIFFRNLPL